MSQHYEVIVVGAGAAGTQVAVGLVAAGFAGSIALLGSESGLPYERPPLSKGYLVGEVMKTPCHFALATIGSSRRPYCTSRPLLNGSIRSVTCTGVRLANGETVPADVVVVGIGVMPNVEPVAVAGAEAPIGLLVDSHGRTTLPDILAAGDCALIGDGGLRLESIPNAAAQAKAVVATLTDSPPPGTDVSWF